MSFPCEKCGKTFNRKDNLTRHLARKIDCTGESLADKMQALKLEIVSELKSTIATENPKTWTDPETGLIYDIVNKDNIDLIKVPVNMKVCYKIIPPKRGKKDKKVSVSYEAVVQPKKTKKVKATSLQDDEDVSEETLKVVDTKFITNLLKRCHQLIYNNNPLGVESPEILHDFTRLLFLVMIQSKLDNSLKTLIDVELYRKIAKKEHDEEYLDSDIKQLSVKTLIAAGRGDFEYGVKAIWHLLSMHPLTKDVFESGGKFKCDLFNLQAILKELYDHMADIKFDELEHDVKGQMFEYFINEYCQGGGKERGAYFTPRKYINLMLQLTNELCSEECKNAEIIYDPYMGSGGILIALDRFKKGELKPEDIYGGERTCNTYMIALMNLILAKASTCSVRRCDSLADNRGLQFDWIATNVPFGVMPDVKVALENPDFTETNYDGDLFDTSDLYNVGKSFKESLFIQHCVNKLAEGGVCSMIVPCGQFLYGRNGLNLRKYIVDNFTLKAVVEVEGGVFQNAAIGTAVLIFTNEGDKHTTEVKFYEIKKDLACYTLKGTVTYEQLAEKNYVLLYKYYEVKKEIDYSYEIKTIGEVCEFITGKKHNVSEGEDVYVDGYFPLICSSSTGKVKWLSSYDYEGPYIVFGTGGVANVQVCEKFNVSTDTKILNPASESINIKYVYYFLKANIDIINDKYFKGVTIKHITLENLQSIEISIPSLEVQQIIIDDYEKYQRQINCIDKLIESSQDLVPVLKRRQLLPLFKADEVKTLGDVCEFNSGKFNSSDKMEKGEYPFYSGTMYNPSGRYDKFCFDYDNYIIFIKDGGSEKNATGEGVGLGTPFIVHGKAAATSHQIAIVPNGETLDVNYLYYFLFISKPNIIKLAQFTTNLGCISLDKIKAIPIPIPSLEIQKEIIAKYEIEFTNIEVKLTSSVEGPSKNKIYFTEQQRKLFEI
jgi:type I restriction-modification system DNA methylase subunit